MRTSHKPFERRASQLDQNTFQIRTNETDHQINHSKEGKVELTKKTFQRRPSQTDQENIPKKAKSNGQNRDIQCPVNQDGQISS